MSIIHGQRDRVARKRLRCLESAREVIEAAWLEVPLHVSDLGLELLGVQPAAVAVFTKAVIHQHAREASRCRARHAPQ